MKFKIFMVFLIIVLLGFVGCNSYGSARNNFAETPLGALQEGDENLHEANPLRIWAQEHYMRGILLELIRIGDELEKMNQGR